MRRLIQSVARLVGTTFEDWLLAVIVVAAIALTVVGVRGCTDDYTRDARTHGSRSR